MKYLSPAKAITPLEGEPLEQLYEELLTRVAELRGFKSYKTRDEFPHAAAFSKGSPLVDLVDDWIPILRYEGYYFILLEKDYERNRVILSVQNLTYRKRVDELESYLPMLQAIEARATVSEWFEASTLPKELLSHPLTFMKSRGLAGWLL